LSHSDIGYQTCAFHYPTDTARAFSAIADLEGAVWLDSCAPHTAGRFDIITAKPYQSLIHEKNKTRLVQKDNVEYLDTPPLIVLDELIPQSSTATPELPFISGAIGYVSYDYGLILEGLQPINKAGTALPDIYFAFYHWSIVIDNHKKCATLCYRDIGQTKVDAFAIKRSFENASSKKSASFHLTTPFTPNMSKEAYFNAFDKIKSHIVSGDSYQVNLSQGFSADFDGDPLKAYLALRKANPMPYAAYMRVGQDAILSFSPELFFEANDNKVLTKPIKGTIARGYLKSADAKAKKELSLSEKDRAENTMIVDLLRNDLSKVCQPLSVKVTKFCEIETFTSVHHLVSSIEGVLKEGITHRELFKHLFPCGSITGAPKHETMKIIDALEVTKRGIYCGGIGYFSAHNMTMFNVAIRTLLLKDRRIYCAGGGGIVYDSEKDKEYQEIRDKINILTDTLGRGYQYEADNL
jgi:para-aminobenzoate synthetase component 1